MSRAELLAALEGRRPLEARDLQEARHEQLAPLLAVRARPADERVRAELDRELKRSLAREIVFERELAWAAGLLHARGIPVLLLKGAALTRLVYRPGERSMSDVDVLVPSDRWREASAALRAAGASVHDPTDRPLTLAAYYNLPLLSPGGVVIELHRRLCGWPLFSVDHDALFRRARAEDGGLRVPDPVDLFLGLAVHAAKHAWALPLRSYVDGRLLLEAGLIDRGLLLERAHAFGAARATATWLRLCESPDDAPAGPRGLAERWLRVARACDDPLRPIVWAAVRLAYRLADRGHRLRQASSRKTAASPDAAPSTGKR